MYTYIHTCIHTCIHTYIHTYTHTHIYIHTAIITYNYSLSRSGFSNDFQSSSITARLRCRPRTSVYTEVFGGLVDVGSLSLHLEIYKGIIRHHLYFYGLHTQAQLLNLRHGMSAASFHPRDIRQIEKEGRHICCPEDLLCASKHYLFPSFPTSW